MRRVLVSVVAAAVIVAGTIGAVSALGAGTRPARPARPPLPSALRAQGNRIARAALATMLRAGRQRPVAKTVLRAPRVQALPYQSCEVGTRCSLQGCVQFVGASSVADQAVAVPTPAGPHTPARIIPIRPRAQCSGGHSVRGPERFELVSATPAAPAPR